MLDITGRRSIRKYKSGEIKQEDINTVLRAAMSAPSAGNAQPWHFIVIDKKEILHKVAENHPYAKMAKEASLGILVCAEPAVEKYKGFWVQDCAAAVENLLLAVHQLRLGAVWVGVYPNESYMKPFRELLHLPEGILPFAFVPIGYPAEKKEPAERFDETKIRYNGWSD